MEGKLRRPIIPKECAHNAHMYYILLPDLATRTRLIDHLKQQDIHSVFHYVPLHNAPAGARYGRAVDDLVVTIEMSDRLLRLPLWLGLEEHQTKVIQQLTLGLTRA